MGGIAAAFAKLKGVWQSSRAARRVASAVSAAASTDKGELKSIGFIAVFLAIALILPLFIIYTIIGNWAASSLSLFGINTSDKGYIYEDQITEKPVYASTDGIAIVPKFDGEEKDFYIKIRVPDQPTPEHPDGIEYIYENLSRINVKDGQQIKKNQIIGYKSTFICPIPTEFAHHISSPFKQVRHINTVSDGRLVVSNGPHYGTDISAAHGVDVVAVSDGTVRVPGYDAKGYGNYVILETASDIDFYYGHLADVVVENGEQVKQGQVLGHVGATGNALGPHLHFEARNIRIPGGREEQNIDPQTVLGINIENHDK